MAVSEEFKAFIAELCEPIGPIHIRNMFGGAGVYCDGIMFGLIADEVFYLKADTETQVLFVAEGQGPFTYVGKGKPIQMSYWQCPERLFDDPDEMSGWARRALDVARKAKRASPPKPKRKKLR